MSGAFRGGVFQGGSFPRAIYSIVRTNKQCWRHLQLAFYSNMNIGYWEKLNFVHATLCFRVKSKSRKQNVVSKTYNNEIKRIKSHKTLKKKLLTYCGQASAVGVAEKSVTLWKVHGFWH